MNITVTEDHDGTITSDERPASAVSLVLAEIAQILTDGEARFGTEVLSGITLYFQTDVPDPASFADAVQVDHLTDEQVEQVAEILDKADE